MAARDRMTPRLAAPYKRAVRESHLLRWIALVLIVMIAAVLAAKVLR
jgi:hypothetical protein